MASGSSGRLNSGSKGFDFRSDDILCSYEDYGNQDSSNAPHSDPNKEFHKTRMARSSVFGSSSYSPPEDSLSQDITATVERTMKKYADNVMRFLEGISSRLSQLELYCYNLDKTIREMRSDLTHEHGDAHVKLKSLEKHLQEVHRSVQILRDKQELAETQKELAKLQLAQKESSSSNHSQPGEERIPTPMPEPKKCDNTSDPHNQHLALALPHQVSPQPHPAPSPLNQPQQQYYVPTQLPNPPAPAPVPASALGLAPQLQPAPGQGQYMSPQPTPSHSQPTPAQSVQSFAQYQQMWPSQPGQPQHQAPPQPHSRPQPSGSYPSYTLTPPNSQSRMEKTPSSIPMQIPYSGVMQQPVQAYGYGVTGRTTTPMQQAPPPLQIKPSSGPPQAGNRYGVSSAHPPLAPPSGYTMYEGSEGGRMQYPPRQPQFPQGGYHPSGVRTPGPPPQLMRNSAYGELVEKLVRMGFGGDHAAGVIQRMEESGQAIDFNAVLDRLSVESSGGPQRGW